MEQQNVNLHVSLDKKSITELIISAAITAIVFILVKKYIFNLKS